MRPKLIKILNKLDKEPAFSKLARSESSILRPMRTVQKWPTKTYFYSERVLKFASLFSNALYNRVKCGEVQ